MSMQVYRRLEDLHLTGAWVTVGGFDGVHLGHQALIRRTVEQAHAGNLAAVVVTFHPAPAVFFGYRPPRYLTPLAEKLPLLEHLGVDIVLVLPFDHALARTPARTFVEALKRHLAMRGLVAGPDFALGHAREGTLERLRDWGREMDYHLEVVEPVMHQGHRISASSIRALLDQGEAFHAAQHLGRWYTLQGRVVPGQGRGNRVGFPTANVRPPEDKWLPALGVYAGWVHWPEGEVWYPAVANLGYRPTFGELPAPLLEVHVLDFQGDLYGRDLTFALVHRLRGEQRFPSVEALRQQIGRDILQAQEVLRHVPRPQGVHPFLERVSP